MESVLKKIKLDDIVYEFFDVQFIDGFSIILKTSDEVEAENAFNNASEIYLLNENGQVYKQVTGYGEVAYRKTITKYYNDENNVLQSAVQIKLKTLDLSAQIKEIENKINPTINEEAMTLDEYKAYRIQQSKDELDKYITENPLKSSAHGGVEATYTVTKEKQDWMVQQYLTYQLEKQINPDAVLTWNESGEVCEEWTEAEFSQLLLEVKAFIYPLRAYQQSVEKAIMACTDKLEVTAITFNYASVSV